MSELNDAMGDNGGYKIQSHDGITPVGVSADNGESSCCRSDTPDRSQSRVLQPGPGTPGPGTHPMVDEHAEPGAKALARARRGGGEVTTPSEELDPKDIELFDLQREVKRFKDALRAADNYAAQLRAEAERLETCWQRDSFRLLFAERENERLRVLVRQVRADFSLAMPFVSGEHGSTAQRSWHERARQALEREK